MAAADQFLQRRRENPLVLRQLILAEVIRFRRDRFDFDWELVCKLIRRGHRPTEVPVNYRSRSYAEGKKVRFFRDPLTWLRAIIASRFEPLA